jgi:hypothetical protein
MDNITMTCESELSEKIQIVMRQTNYDDIVAREKLLEHGCDVIKVVKAYMGIGDKKTSEKKSLNQEIYRQLRYRLDDSIRDFNSKQEDKLKAEIESNKLSGNP